MLGTEVIGDDLATGRLVPLLVEQVPPRELPIHVVYASRRHLSAKVRSFVDFLPSVSLTRRCGPRSSRSRRWR